MNEDDFGQDQGGQDFSQGQQDQGTGLNPAWNDLLSHVPQEAHSQVTPLLQQWDQNYQNGIQKVHSQYEGYKPFIDNGVQPDQIGYALSLLDAIESRPEEVMAAMQQYFGQGEEQDQGYGDPYEEQGQDQFDITQHPQFQELNNVVQQMAQLMVQDRSQQEAQQQDEMLDQEISGLKEKYGDFDENWVFSQVLMNPEMELEQAVQAYGDFVNNLRGNANRPGPRVLGQGSSIPQGVQPKNLDGKGRRDLIQQMLQQQLGQG